MRASSPLGSHAWWIARPTLAPNGIRSRATRPAAISRWRRSRSRRRCTGGEPKRTQVRPRVSGERIGEGAGAERIGLGRSRLVTDGLTFGEVGGVAGLLELIG